VIFSLIPSDSNPGFNSRRPTANIYLIQESNRHGARNAPGARVLRAAWAVPPRPSERAILLE
jgi:hypothetical protein